MYKVALWYASRCTVKHLLQCDFFLEESGLKVELVNREDEVSNQSVIQMRLRVVDPKKRKDKHKENEAIQFDFDMYNDQPEEVAQELVSTRFLLKLKFCAFLYINAVMPDRQSDIMNCKWCYLIHMNNIWIYVSSCVCQASCPAI